jgi:hypothetical protein
MIDIINLDLLLILGIISGILQVFGYWFYLRNDEIDPNPVSWFMFAYGTAILVVLEWDKSATLAELILPISCALLSILVSVRCWKKSRKLDPTKWWPEDWWPEDKIEQYSFVSDILITIGYILAWLLAFATFINTETRELAVFMFLFLSNLSTFPSFYPILNTTYKHPEREYWLPWFLWAAAYILLGYITYATHGKIWHILMMYPVTCALLHALVGILALRKRVSTQ